MLETNDQNSAFSDESGDDFWDDAIDSGLPVVHRSTKPNSTPQWVPGLELLPGTGNQTAGSTFQDAAPDQAKDGLPQKDQPASKDSTPFKPMEPATRVREVEDLRQKNPAL